MHHLLRVLLSGHAERVVVLSLTERHVWNGSKVSEVWLLRHCSALKDGYRLRDFHDVVRGLTKFLRALDLRRGC